MSNPRCPICGHATTELVIAAPDFRLGRVTPRYPVWACPHCGAGVTATTLWDDAARAAAYEGDYEPHRLISQPAQGWRGRLAATIRASWGYPQDDALPLPGFLVRPLRWMRSWTWMPPPPPPGRLLDVGCGSGAYGASLIRLGWQVDGVEPDPQAAALARAQGLRVQNVPIEAAELPPNAYHVITMWHVLEHVSSPVAVLRRLRPALREDGLLWVEVPNRASWGARCLGPTWYHWDLPRHRVHFAPHSLKLALEQGGFRVLSIQHIPNPHGLAHGLAYRLHRASWGRHPLFQAMGWGFGLTAALFHGADVIRAVGVPIP